MKKKGILIIVLLLIGFCIGALICTIRYKKNGDNPKCKDEACETNNIENELFNDKIKQFIGSGKYLCDTYEEEMGFDYLSKCFLLRNETLYALKDGNFKELANNVSDLFLLNYGNAGMKMFFYINKYGKLFYINNEKQGKAYQSFALLPDENAITVYNSLFEDSSFGTSHLINVFIKTVNNTYSTINIDSKLNKIIETIYE